MSVRSGSRRDRGGPGGDAGDPRRPPHGPARLRGDANVTNAPVAAGSGLRWGCRWPRSRARRARPAKGAASGGAPGRCASWTTPTTPTPPRSARRSSTLAAARAARRLIVVLGDMLELGEIGEEVHREVGRAVAVSGAAEFIGVGRLARVAVESARGGLGECHHVGTFEDTVALLLKRLAPGDAVLVKGSAACAWSGWWMPSWPGSEETMPDALPSPRSAGPGPHRLQRLPVHHVPGGDGDGDRAHHLVRAGAVADRAAPPDAAGRRDDPRGHPERHRAKAGTPTMGGFAHPGGHPGTTLLWANLRTATCGRSFSHGGSGRIGFLDDWRKLRTRKGVSAAEVRCPDPPRRAHPGVALLLAGGRLHDGLAIPSSRGGS